MSLIDEAFGHDHLWQENGDERDYQQWVRGLKTQIQVSLQTWSSAAGAEAGKLLPSLKQKASQWWYFWFFST
ncbi:MAG: hypothetical protein F6K56_28300 [Moorea sp. SIO3G5]|nr:hypothetical protein [Moorena sp. SIO3G5]